MTSMSMLSSKPKKKGAGSFLQINICPFVVYIARSSTGPAEEEIVPIRLRYLSDRRSQLVDETMAETQEEHGSDKFQF